MVVLTLKELYFPLIYPRDLIKPFHFFQVFSKGILNNSFLKQRKAAFVLLGKLVQGLTNSPWKASCFSKNVKGKEKSYTIID